jgi:Peptidase family S41/N-terminal domain of Peptidase_S41 in eukaryotic IRBP
MRPRHHVHAMLALLVLVPAAGGAQAGGSSEPPRPLDAAIRRAVIDTMGARLRRHYVDADTGAMIAAHLEQRVAAGAYDGITSPARFAEVVTTDLRAINGDRHLNLTYSPGSAGFVPGPEGIQMFGGPGPARPGGPPPVNTAGRQAHYSFGRVDVLPGNVGYVDIRGFAGAPEVADVIVSALKYLEWTDAIIFDVRRNGGGSPMSVNLLISHFTTADTVASLTVKNRSGHETFTRYTLRDVPGPRRPTVPLFVLTSGATASAAEDFTFVLQNMKRATIVGARTAGAGHNNANLAVGHGFGMSTSFTRVMDPRTGREWERIGVVPDVEVDEGRALDVALALALEGVSRGEADGRRRKVLDLTREAIAARAAPREVPQARLASYAGLYDEGRAVQLEDGRLLYRPRPGFPPDTMVALSDTSFAVRATRFVFERPAPGGRVRLRVIPPEGESLTYERRGEGSDR